MSDEAGTTMTSYSPVRRAIGVVFSSVTADWLVRMAPTITRPLTIRTFGLPFSLSASCARPIVPPAPVTFSTVADLAMPADCMASCMARAVWSQPPPGLAGAMILMSSRAKALDAAARPADRANAARVRRAIGFIYFLPMDAPPISAGCVGFCRDLKASAPLSPPLRVRTLSLAGSEIQAWQEDRITGGNRRRAGRTARQDGRRSRPAPGRSGPCRGNRWPAAARPGWRRRAGSRWAVSGM